MRYAELQMRTAHTVAWHRGQSLHHSFSGQMPRNPWAALAHTRHCTPWQSRASSIGARVQRKHGIPSHPTLLVAPARPLQAHERSHPHSCTPPTKRARPRDQEGSSKVHIFTAHPTGPCASELSAVMLSSHAIRARGTEKGDAGMVALALPAHRLPLKCSHQNHPFLPRALDEGSAAAIVVAAPGNGSSEVSCGVVPLAAPAGTVASRPTPPIEATAASMVATTVAIVSCTLASASATAAFALATGAAAGVVASDPHG